MTVKSNGGLDFRNCGAPESRGQTSRSSLILGIWQSANAKYIEAGCSQNVGKVGRAAGGDIRTQRNPIHEIG